MAPTVRDSLLRLREIVDSGELAAAVAALGVDLVVLHGSALRAGEPADVDVAVAFDPGGSERPFLDVVNALGRLVPGDHLDVLPLDTAGPVARHRALATAEVLYLGRPGAYADRQMAAFKEFLETERFRRLDIALMSQ